MVVDSQRQKWATPQWFFDGLTEIFGTFALDVCAEPWSAKCPRFFTEADNGLAQDWAELFFCNPPFKDAKKWIDYGLVSGCEGVFVLPNATDTRWFAEVQPRVDTYLVSGRVNFIPPQGVVSSSNNRGSMVLPMGTREVCGDILMLDGQR